MFQGILNEVTMQLKQTKNPYPPPVPQAYRETWGPKIDTKVYDLIQGRLFLWNNGQKNNPHQGVETIRDSSGDKGTAAFNESGCF